MSYLRFTPSEYRAIARVCRPLDLGGYDPPAFQRILALSLSHASAALAGRIRGLRKAEAQLLHDHLRAEGPNGGRSPFTPEEWRALAEVCDSLPSPVRFALPLKGMLVRRLRAVSPAMARKLGRMSGTQFVRLYEQVRERRPGNV